MRKAFFAVTTASILALGGSPGTSVAQETEDVDMTETVDDGDDDGGKLGLLGLLGLAGLMGLKRRDKDHDYVARPRTDQPR